MNYKVLILFLIYVVFIISLGFFNPKSQRSRYGIRKGVHLFTGLIIFYLTFRISREALLWLFVGGTFFSFLTYSLKRFNYIHVTRESSLGTLFYPLGILSSFLVLYHLPIHYFQTALMFLVVSDTLANLGGYLLNRNPEFMILSEKKTPLGILFFSVSAFMIALLLLPGSRETLAFILLTVVCAIHFEIISYRGSDNLAIPLGSAFFFLLTYDIEVNSIWLTAVMLVMAMAAVFFYKKAILTRNGSIAAYLLGVYLFGILGPEWGLPVAVFFISSVLFTRLNSRVNQKKNRSGERNVWQVTANIAVGVLISVIYLITADPIYIWLFISVVSAVTADTWASEIGPVFQKRCFSLSTRKSAAAGISGGISLSGTLAAYSGALAIALIGLYGFGVDPDLKRILALSFSGLLASFVDSILGAFLEPWLLERKFFLNNRGSRNLTPNDLVNFLASFSAPLFYLLMESIM